MALLDELKKYFALKGETLSKSEIFQGVYEATGAVPEKAPGSNLGAPANAKVYFGGPGEYTLNGMVNNYQGNINMFFWDKLVWQVLEVPIDLSGYIKDKEVMQLVAVAEDKSDLIYPAQVAFNSMWANTSQKFNYFNKLGAIAIIGVSDGNVNIDIISKKDNDIIIHKTGSYVTVQGVNLLSAEILGIDDSFYSGKESLSFFVAVSGNVGYRYSEGNNGFRYYKGGNVIVESSAGTDIGYFILTPNPLYLNAGISELDNLKKELLFVDNFYTAKSWEPLSDYPITPIIGNNRMTLSFSSGTHQGCGVALNNDYFISGSKRLFSLKIRRKSGTGGGLDIGGFGSAIKIGENPAAYKTILANEITSDFKIFSFYMTPISDFFVIGTHASRNEGATFEIADLYIRRGDFLTETAKRIEALEEVVESPASIVTGAELEAYLVAHRSITLSPGIIEINEAITIPSNTTIRGIKGSILKLVGNGNIINLNSGSSNIIFDGVTFVGKNIINPTSIGRDEILSKTGMGVNNGIYANGTASDISIRNCEFINFNGAGINLYRTHNRYSRTFKITDNVFENSYIGLLSGVRSEYHSFVGNTFGYNKIGAYIEGGNNFGSSNQFNANGVGLVVSGTKGENDSHGTMAACSFNHNISYSIYTIDIDNGFSFSGCHCFDGNICLDNSKGFLFTGGLIACAIEIVNENNSYNIIANNIFFLDSYGGGNISGNKDKLLLAGNRFIEGTNSASINNDV